MRRIAAPLALAFLLGGCSYAWIRPDATAAQARADEQVCRTQAAQVVNDVWIVGGSWAWGPTYRPWGPSWYGPGWYGRWPDPSAEPAAQQRLYDGCMRAKGYELVRLDRKTGEPR